MGKKKKGRKKIGTCTLPVYPSKTHAPFGGARKKKKVHAGCAERPHIAIPPPHLLDTTLTPVEIPALGEFAHVCALCYHNRTAGCWACVCFGIYTTDLARALYRHAQMRAYRGAMDSAISLAVTHVYQVNRVRNGTSPHAIQSYCCG